MTAMTAKSIGGLSNKPQKKQRLWRSPKSCFSAALANGAEVIITIDGDGQHNPDEISQLLDYILKRTHRFCNRI